MNTVFALGFGALLLACNSSSGGTNDCNTAGQTLCQKAAACSTDGKTRLLLGADGGGGDISFDNESGCQTLFTLGCAQPHDGGTFDAAACNAALATAQCGTSSFGAGLILPPACN